MSVNFTWHATERLRERSIMKPEELIEIIEKERFIVVGCEGRKQYRQHLLFYSISDDLYMVAVYDIHSKSVITILPIEYHSVLTKELLDEAYSLSGIEPLPNKSKTWITRDKPGRMRITAILESKKKKYITNLPMVNDFNTIINRKELRDIIEYKTRLEKSPIVAIGVGIKKQGMRIYKY